MIQESKYDHSWFNVVVLKQDPGFFMTHIVGMIVYDKNKSPILVQDLKHDYISQIKNFTGELIKWEFIFFIWGFF